MTELFRILTYRTFEPTEISGLQVWLNNETLGADGSSVSQWDDSSGNNFHFTQPNASYRPTVYSDSGSKTIRLLENSFLTCLVDLSLLRNVSGGTTFIVHKQLMSSYSPTLIISSGLNSYDARLNTFVSVNKYVSQMRVIDSDTVKNAISNQTIDQTKYWIQSTAADFENNDLYQYINSNLDGTNINTGGSYSSSTDSVAIFLGANLLSPAYEQYPSSSLFPKPIDLARVQIKEVLIFNRILTALEKFNIERYLSIKHNINLTKLVPSTSLFPSSTTFIPW